MSQTFSCGYHEGQHLILNVIPHGDCNPAHQVVHVKVLENISQTLSWTGVVSVEQGHSFVLGYRIAFLKLYDRKAAHELRANHGVERWTRDIEQSYLDALGDNSLDKFMYSLRYVENYQEETENTWDSPEKEAFFSYELHRMWENETKVYRELQPFQGNTMPKFLSPVEVAVEQEPAEPRYHPLRVKGILLEYVRGCTLLEVRSRFQHYWYQYIAERAIFMVRTLDAHNILNMDVNPMNFVVALVPSRSDPLAQTVRVCMVDFGLCRFREPHESDWDWAMEKLEHDEEGKLLNRLKEELRHYIGCTVHIEKSTKYEMYRNMAQPNNSNSYDTSSNTITNTSPTTALPPPTQVAALYSSQLVPQLATPVSIAAPVVPTATSTPTPVTPTSDLTSDFLANLLHQVVMQPERNGTIEVTWPVLPQRAMYAQAPVNVEVEDLPPLRNVTTSSIEEISTFEYLDHTADVQIHAWGGDFETALAASAVAVHGYMVTLSEHEPKLEVEFVSKGYDMNSMVFNFLDEALYHFHARGFVMRHIEVLEVNRDKWSVRAVARGAIFGDGCAKGTEVKAITYSNMRVEENEDNADIYVIVDI